MQPSSNGNKTTLQHLISATDKQAVQETIAMREATTVSPDKPNEPGMTHVSLSDSDGDGGKVRSKQGLKQANKRARRAVKKAEQQRVCKPKTASTSASSKSEDVTNGWSFVDMVSGMATMDVKVVGGVGGQPVGQEGRATATRLCAEGGRATLGGESVGQEGRATATRLCAEGGRATLGGEPVGQEGRATATRLCAEGGRATLQSAGSAEDGGGEASSNNLPCTGGGDVQPPEPPKHSLWCSKCGDNIMRMQDLLLAAGGRYGLDAEWQEAIWGLCFPCSGRLDDEFKRESRREWQKRGKALGGRVRRARNINFDNCSKIIAEELPGAKNSLVRELSFLRLKCCCLALAVALEEESSFSLEARDISNKIYFDRIVAAAADPSSAATQEGQVFAATELSYLTSVCENFSVSFVCRRSNCLWFGLNSEWPKDRGSYHFACPCCGMPYKPFQTLADCEKFQFVLAMPDIVNGGMLFIPAMWANGQDENWLRKQMEIYALQITNADELKSYTLGTATRELTEYIKAIAPPVYFESKPWVRPLWIEPRYDISLYEQRGTTFGCKLDKVRDAEAIASPFEDWPHLAALMAKVVAKAREGDGAATRAVSAMR
jgi:hypothetical protein